ncbi:MAG: fatty acid desaturase [Gemmataceae bacterium]|nr:fatty acid desaturase [Gemmataceae bacterium]
MATAPRLTNCESLSDPRIKEALQFLRQTDNVTNWWYLARTYLYFVVVIGGTLWFYHVQASQGWHWAWNIPVTLLAITLVGAGQHQLTGLAHEAAHHILFRHRLWNDLASDLFCMFPMYSTTHHYRLQHIAHHQFVNDPDRDPDVSQLQSSGHWLNFPVSRSQFLSTLAKQLLWPVNLVRFMRIRATYNAMPTDKNPYVKKGFKPSRLPTRIGIVYLLTLIAVLAALVYWQQPVLLAVVPLILWAAALAVFGWMPERYYHHTRIHPVISARTMTLLRVSYITALFVVLAWLSWYVTPWTPVFYVLLWIVPIFTSFSFFMMLRQIVQHGNGDRGWLTNTRVFFVHPFIRFAVFPMGQDYHLPHHTFASVPHYRLKQLHELLMQCAEYRNQVIEVEGYFFPYHRPPTKPTVLDVLGPRYHHRAEEIYIDNSVLEDDVVEEKEEILREGEEEKRRRREAMAQSQQSPVGAAG